MRPSFLSYWQKAYRYEAVFEYKYRFRSQFSTERSGRTNPLEFWFHHGFEAAKQYARQLFALKYQGHDSDGRPYSDYVLAELSRFDTGHHFKKIEKPKPSRKASVNKSRGRFHGIHANKGR